MSKMAEKPTIITPIQYQPINITPSLQKPEKKIPSYHQNPSLPPQAKTLCEIIANAPLETLQKTLENSNIKPFPQLIEQVLEFSYNYPSSAVTFFRWAGLGTKHSARSWSLMVDLLGKNKHFEPMWDAIRSMKQENVLSVATFVSVFESYCLAGRVSEALMSFDVMERYGVVHDIVAVNALLSAICRERGKTLMALEFFEKVKNKVLPNGDTFAILLEGWEKEGNLVKAMSTFGEMVIKVGWSNEYVCAYDSFLTTLVRGLQVDDALRFLNVMKGKNCLPGLKFFTHAIDMLVKQNDSVRAVDVWGVMVGGGLVPNLVMYNSMIGLLCNNNDVENAFCFLDAMAFHGAFPDSLSYNMIFNCLVKNKKVREAGRFFNEMVKNECPPTHPIYALGIRMFLDYDDPEMAIELWETMLKDRVLLLEYSANALLFGLTTMDRLIEVLKYLEDILDRKVQIHDSTMEKMRVAFSKRRRADQETFQRLTQKWKPSVLPTSVLPTSG